MVAPAAEETLSRGCEHREVTPTLLEQPARDGVHLWARVLSANR